MEKELSLRTVINERNRLVYLMLFYRTTREDQDFFVKEIKKYNQIIDAKKSKNFDNVINSKNSSEQFEFFLRKLCENNTQINQEKTKTKYLEMIKRHH